MSSEFNIKPRLTSLSIDIFPCYMSNDRMVMSLMFNIVLLKSNSVRFLCILVKPQTKLVVWISTLPKPELELLHRRWEVILRPNKSNAKSFVAGQNLSPTFSTI